MPIYEFVCKKCGRVAEVRAKMGDEVETPVCCGQPMKRTWTASFILKGGGWAWRPNDEIPTEELPPRRRRRDRD